MPPPLEVSNPALPPALPPRVRGETPPRGAAARPTEATPPPVRRGPENQASGVLTARCGAASRTAATTNACAAPGATAGARAGRWLAVG